MAYISLFLHKPRWPGRLIWDWTRAAPQLYYSQSRCSAVYFHFALSLWKMIPNHPMLWVFVCWLLDLVCLGYAHIARSYLAFIDKLHAVIMKDHKTLENTLTFSSLLIMSRVHFFLYVDFSIASSITRITSCSFYFNIIICLSQSIYFIYWL